MSWGKKIKGKPMIENKFCVLVKFIKPPFPLPPAPYFVKGYGGMCKKKFR